MPAILLVDDKENDRALMEILLRERLPAAQLSVVADPVELGELLAGAIFQAALIDADCRWCDSHQLVARLRGRNSHCLVVFYSEAGIKTLTPEIADLALTGFYSKSRGDLLAIPRTLAQRLEKVDSATAISELSTTSKVAEGDRPQPPATEADANFHNDMFQAMSHDLKQPLHIFSRQIKLLDKNYKKQLDGGGKALVENMGKVAGHMELLLDSIFSYYRLDSTDKYEEDQEPVAEVIQSVLTTFKTDLDEISASVTVGDLPELRVSQGRMTQLFQNLVNNAIKFRGEDALTIEISAIEVSGNWLFTVKDNGIGIEEDKLEQIFTMFKRLHGQGKYPGSGVGLALCKRIVEQAGGKIWARSKPGEGVAIHFTLPKQSNKINATSSGSTRTNNEAPDKGPAG